MNTPNLDELINQAAEADRSSYEGARIRTQFARLFATHGPALVAVLKQAYEKLEIYRAHSDGEYHGGIEHSTLIATIKGILLKLDQEATCQK